MSRFRTLRRQLRAMRCTLKSEGGALVVYGLERVGRGEIFKPLARCANLGEVAAWRRARLPVVNAPQPRGRSFMGGAPARV